MGAQVRTMARNSYRFYYEISYLFSSYQHRTESRGIEGLSLTGSSVPTLFSSLLRKFQVGFY